MRVLGIDTSTGLGSVACLVDGQLAAEVTARVGGKHGETMFAMLEQALAHAGLARDALDLIACGLGPGSFTGTRVGVAVAKGLALALDRPLVGVSTLEALALGVPGDLIAPVADAFQGEVFLAVYERAQDHLRERMAPAHGAPAAMRALLDAHPGALVFGSGARRYPDVFPASLPPVYDAPRAALIAHAGLALFERRGPDDRAALEPLYVRASDAKLPT
jgi:tRNA threonylcarbamoyladenosine biosynthesis protein TsaB